MQCASAKWSMQHGKRKMLGYSRVQILCTLYKCALHFTAEFCTIHCAMLIWATGSWLCSRALHNGWMMRCFVQHLGRGRLGCWAEMTISTRPFIRPPSYCAQPSSFLLWWPGWWSWVISDSIGCDKLVNWQKKTSHEIKNHTLVVLNLHPFNEQTENNYLEMRIFCGNKVITPLLPSKVNFKTLADLIKYHLKQSKAMGHRKYS